MKSDLIELDLQVHHRTDRGILVSDTGDKEDAEWLPLAHVEVEMRNGGTARVTMPEWLAIDRGFA